MADARRALLVAALGFARAVVSPEPPELRALRAWLGSWTGIGAIEIGMARQGYEPAAHPIRGSGLAGELLPVGHRAFGRVGIRLGADAGGRGAAGGVGGAASFGASDVNDGRAADALFLRVRSHN